MRVHQRVRERRHECASARPSFVEPAAQPSSYHRPRRAWLSFSRRSWKLPSPWRPLLGSRPRRWCSRWCCGNAARLLVDGLRAGVTTEQPRRRELAELVADHVLRHVHRNELVAVVHGEGVTDEVGDDRARPRPGLDDLLRVRRVHRVDFRLQRFLDVRPFLYASRHLLIPWFATSSHLDYFVALPRFRPRTIRRCEAFLWWRVFTPSLLPHLSTTLRPPRVRPPCG